MAAEEEDDREPVKERISELEEEVRGHLEQDGLADDDEVMEIDSTVHAAETDLADGPKVLTHPQLNVKVKI